MLKVTILLPTTYNDGLPVWESRIRCILNSLRELTGGYTIDGSVKGTYKMDDGPFATDDSIKVWVVVDCALFQRLREWAESVCVLLNQESLYFEYHETKVEFIRP